MKEKAGSENKMANAPVKKLMLWVGMPIIISMMLQAFYNIVDSIFVSNMAQNGELALNALTLAFPVQMLMVAIGVGTGVGTNALLSKSLGAGENEKAGRVAGISIFLSFIIYIVFLLFGIFGTEYYISSQSSNPVIIEMGTQYLRICCVYSFGLIFFSTFEKLLQSTGRSGLSTVSQVSGAVTNIVLDPIMIYGLLGCKEMGVAGAAYATVIGQIVSFAVGLIFYLKYCKEIKNSPKYLKPNLNIIKEIYSIGFPAIVSQALMSFMTYGLNIIYGKIDENVVTAYGLYYKIQQFVMFAAFGMRDAITPIISYNHGRKEKNRMTQGIKYGIIYTVVIMAVGMLIIEALADPLSTVFGLSGETRSICVTAMRVISVSFVFAGVNIALQGIFQALNAGWQSLVISLLRQFVLVIPVSWIVLRVFNVTQNNLWAEWCVFIFAEFISLLIAVWLLKGVYKKQISPLEG